MTHPPMLGLIAMARRHGRPRAAGRKAPSAMALTMGRPRHPLEDGGSATRQWWWSPPLLVLSAAVALYALSMVVVPLALPAGTIPPLEEGNANIVDFGDQWAKLDPYSRLVYTIGDSQCHQKLSRSLVLNGNQFPMCARMTSITMFSFVGLVVAARLVPYPSITATMMALYPRSIQQRFLPRRSDPPALYDRRMFHCLWLVTGLVVAFLLPVAIDGFTQLWTPYESTNPVRVLTGMWTGIIGGTILGVMVNNPHFLTAKGS